MGGRAGGAGRAGGGGTRCRADRTNWDAPYSQPAFRRDGSTGRATRSIAATIVATTGRTISPDLSRNLNRDEIAIMGRVWPADGPRAATPAVPTGRVVVHALAGAPRRAQSARGLSARQRVVARDERAPAAGRMRDGRAAGWVGRRAVIAGRAVLAGVQRPTDGEQLVPSAQREHRRRLPGALEPRRSRERTRALLHERRASARPLRTCPRCGAAPCARTVRCARPRARRPSARDGRRLPLAAARAAQPLSARSRRGRLHRRRAASRPDARLRGDRAAAASPVRVVCRRARRTPPADLVRDGSPIYAWPFEQREVWRTPSMPLAARVLERATRAR